MAKGKMLDIDLVEQVGENDCWICCTVMIHNYYFPRKKMLYGEDLSGKRVIPQSIQEFMDLHGLGEDDQSSAPDCLSFVDAFSVKIDEWALPTFEDVVEAIGDGVPLLCLVGTEKPEKNQPDPQYKGGHWTILAGYEESEEGKFLHFVDPDRGFLRVGNSGHCQYAPNAQGEALYVENTTYVEYETNKKEL